MPIMKCPFCAEEIQDDAKKCKYCGEWLDAAPQGKNQVGFLEILCFLCPVLGLIVYIVLLGPSPVKAAQMGRAAGLGAVLWFLIWLALHH